MSIKVCEPIEQPKTSAHPEIEKVAITGSTASGIRVIKDSADTLKHLTMELGGKSANIIFADADLDVATQTAYDGILDLLQRYFVLG